MTKDGVQQERAPPLRMTTVRSKGSQEVKRGKALHINTVCKGTMIRLGTGSGLGIGERFSSARYRGAMTTDGTMTTARVAAREQ